MKHNEFGKQLQLAIIDMIRDKYLTARAYEDGYDELPGVQREVSIWRDNLNYLTHKNNYLKSVGFDTSSSMNQYQVIDLILNPYVDSLLQKYSSSIEINMEEFDEVKLTSIPMSVIQQNVPYAKPVPGFPLVTSNFRLNYGTKMDVK